MVKLTYEQMRHLAELGDSGGRLTVKNRLGKVLQPTLKRWGRNESPKETRSMCTAVQPKPSHAPMGNPSPTCQQASCSQLPRRPGKQ